MPELRQLPVIAPQRAERADAARNRQAILNAARELLQERGPGSITMDCLAERAGVGKGTLFRRFGDRPGLFLALLDETERELQEGFIRGPAPLGPGAPAPDRLIAFGRALIALTAERGELMLAAEPTQEAERMRSPVRGAYRSHLLALLSQREPELAGYLADVLLAALSPGLVLHQLSGGMSLEALQEAWTELIHRLVGGS